MFDVAQSFPELRFIDFGSGFKVKYKEDDGATDIEEHGKEFTFRFKEFCKQYGRDLELWCEPGKFLVSDSGLLLVKANIVKQTLSTVFFFSSRRRHTRFDCDWSSDVCSSD